MSLINLKDLEFKYPANDFNTINKINLDIEDGEFVVLVGPSGCGKSTLLKVLSGLEDVTDGEILVNDKLINYKEPKDRDLAMVFQNYALYPHFTVKKNISFGLKNMKIKKEEIENRVNKVSDMLIIEDQLDKMPKGLSGGQQQRVALARAIVREPLIYLFDEPLSNLDAKLRNKTRNEIVEMHKELKKTFIYVTHDQVEAMTMADRIVVLKDGEVQQFDRPINIFYNPKNLFVAKFMGSPEINVFNCEQKDNKMIFANKEEIKLHEKVSEKVIEQKNVIVGIRPDDIEYSFEQKEGYIEVEVKNREILGNHTILNGFLGKDRMDVQIRTNEYLEGLSKIYIKVDMEKSYFFDSKTELNLNA